MTGSPRRRVPIPSVWHLALLSTLLFVLLLGVDGRPRGHVLTGDTPGVARGTRVALDCIHLGRFRGCGAEQGNYSSYVRPFPALQYLPTAALVKAGWSNIGILRGLADLSFVAFVSMLGLVLLVGRRLRSPAGPPLLLAVLLSGPLLFYATSAFGEALSAALLLAAVVSVIARRPALIALFALLAGLGKETMPAFVVFLGLAVGRDEEGGGLLPARRILWPLLAGSALAVVAAAGFNQFRFGSWGNRKYLQPSYDIGQIRAARNLWNLMVAPNGGLAWFWTSACLVLVALAVAAVIAARRRRSAAVPAVLVLATFGVLMAGLASWWSPFGWVAYGPRLAVPVIPALAVAAIYAGGRDLHHVVGTVLRRGWAVGALTVVMLVSAWPQAGAPWQGERLPRLIPVYDPVCARNSPPRSEPFFDCLDQIAWWRDPNQLVEASSGGGRGALAGRVLVLTAITLCIAEARRRVRAADAGQAVDPGRADLPGGGPATTGDVERSPAPALR